MFKVTREDIQRIGDEDTLIHFLEEKLNLPIPEGSTLAQIALPLPLLFLELDESIAEQIIDCQDLIGLPQDALGERRPFLIRFRYESGYLRVLREVAICLHQKTTNPGVLFFICANEYFQPFAFAYFDNSTAGHWHTAVLNILAWTQDNTHVHTSSKHELPSDFFSNTPTSQPVESTSPRALFTKIKSTGTPLSRYGNIYSGILTGYNQAFIINESRRQELINQNITSSELIKPVLTLGQKWKVGLTYLIWIPSSENKHWPWSEARDETEAKQIFEEKYPAISAHLRRYENNLKSRNHQGRFYWELAASCLYSLPKQPKIVYPRNRTSMRATYDTSKALPLFSGHFIPTEDLSLLAILNSTLFDWYVQTYRAFEPNSRQEFKNAFMKNAPIAARTRSEKNDLALLVHQILAAPDSLAVSDFEKRIDALVYELYKLTDAEIALITGHEQLESKPQHRTTVSETPISTQHVAPNRNQTEIDHLLEMLQKTESQPTVSPPNVPRGEKAKNPLIASISSDTLLTKLEDIGTPLGGLKDINIGITTGYDRAFVINEFIRKHLLAKNSNSIEIMKRLPKSRGKWKCTSTYIIYIPSTRNRWWPWSDARNETEAERIFEASYPAIKTHLDRHKAKLKNRSKSHQGKFYWELRESNLYSMPENPKIIYPTLGRSMRAVYDTLLGVPLSSSFFIPTTDLSLLAILNSNLFDWYAYARYRPSQSKQLFFTKKNMVNAPIANRTDKQKENLSHLVQQILDAPNSPAVSALEDEINMLVYNLYELTSAEIALIEEESN